MTGLRDRLAEHLEASGLLKGPGLALLAVSGGPDSVAMLDLLHHVGPSRALSLLVVHVDHGIHPESGRIGASVASLAQGRYGLETITMSLGLGPAVSETQAREGRYAALRQVQEERAARWIVTAHHADDQAETVLLRLLRGSGPAGLAGMAAIGAGGLVRPLLPFTHLELVEHATALGLSFFDDPANADHRHTRSWLRHAVLPVLRARLGEEADRALLSVARHAADDVAAWDAALDLLAGLDLRCDNGRIDVARVALGGYDSLLASRVIRAAAHRAGFMLGPAQAARVVAFAPDAASGRSLDIGDGMVADVSFDRLILRATSRTTEKPNDGMIEGAEGAREFAGLSLRWRVEPAPERMEREGWTTWIAAGAIAVRLPRPGERILPLGGTGRRAVAKLLMEERIPRGDRAAWPVILRDDEPVWIPGICRADAAIPVPGTLAVRMDAAAR
jgi:tRNA(Ile)-lysidine synthase